MGKYRPLASYLGTLRVNGVRLTFAEVEGLLDSPLPESAGLYRAWWANDATHVQADDGWLKAGWVVDFVDMRGRVVELRRAQQSRRSELP